MEADNSGLLIEETDQSPPLLDPFQEEVGETKLEIHRVRNRINVIKAFYQHMRSSESATVRRELGEKVNAETEIVIASLAKISETLTRWKKTPPGEREEVTGGVRGYLREVVNEYQQVLDQHRQLSLTKLQDMLKVTATREKSASEVEKGNSSFIVDQAHLRTLNEQTHIEIEERYGELLRTDRVLRSLKLKFSPFLSSAEYTDLAVLQLSRIIDQDNRPSNLNQRSNKSRKIFLLAGASSFALIIMVFLILIF